MKAVFQLVILTMICLPAAAASQGQQGQQGQQRTLTLNDAIRAALESNADVGIAEEVRIQASSRVKEQYSVLLPNVGGSVGFTNQTINLGSRGLDFPGIPHMGGPFSNLDARFVYSQPVLDLTLIRRYRSARESAGSSESDTLAVRNRVAAMVATLYFGVQRARAREESVTAQIALDETLLKLANDRREAGVGTGLDVTRAQARLATDQYELVESRDQARTSELRLLRAIGDSLDVRVELTDPLASGVFEASPAAEAVATAFRNRPELRSEESRLAAARLTLGAAHAEALPSIRAFADYGNSGNRSVFIPTRTVGIQVNVPLFEGGRRAAHRETAQSQLRQAEIRAKDVRDQIEVDVRVAVEAFASARELLRASEQSLRLAEEELALSRLRFEAQVTTQVDVISAQAALAAARFRHVNALFGVRSAEIEYRRAVGVSW